SYATHGSNLDIETLNIDGYDYQPNRTYYWKFDEQDLAEKIKILQEHLEIPVDSDEENIEGNEQQEEQGEQNYEQEPNYEEEPYGEDQNQEQDPYGEEQKQEQYQEQNPYGEDNY